MIVRERTPGGTLSIFAASYWPSASWNLTSKGRRMTKENAKKAGAAKAKKPYQKPTLLKYEKIKRVHAYF